MSISRARSLISERKRGLTHIIYWRVFVPVIAGGLSRIRLLSVPHAIELIQHLMCDRLLRIFAITKPSVDVGTIVLNTNLLSPSPIFSDNDSATALNSCNSLSIRDSSLFRGRGLDFDIFILICLLLYHRGLLAFQERHRKLLL